MARRERVFFPKKKHVLTSTSGRSVSSAIGEKLLFKKNLLGLFGKKRDFVAKKLISRATSKFKFEIQPRN